MTFKETLTPILGPAADVPKDETLADFMNMKFKEVHDNTLYNRNQISILTSDETINLYVNTTGNDNNDGLTLSTPFKTVQKAFDYLTLNAFRLNTGSWQINIAQGTYDGASINKALYAKNRIMIVGAVDANNIPTVIIDGTTSTKDSGFAFNVTNYIGVKDIKFTNWTKSSTSCGLVGSNGVNLYTVNVHVNNVTWSGINNNYNGRLYVEGGIITNCGTGIRAYDGTHFTIGYKGDSVKRVSISNCNIGIEPRNVSMGHIDWVDINACQSGVYCYNSARFHMLGCTVTNCTQYGVQLNINGTWFNSNVTPNVFSGNAVDEIRFGYSTELNEGNRIIYNVPSSQYVFKSDANANAFGNSNCKFVIASSGSSGLNIQSGDTDSCFLYLGTKSSTAKHGFLINNATNVMQIRVNNVNVARLTNAEFRAEVDNTLSLGGASFRWKEIFSATSTINTSDRNEKQQIEKIPNEVLDAWEEVNFVRFKFNDAVNEKGDNARWHIGLIAQQIKEVFEKHGLDATEYGLLCYNEWNDIYEKDENGNDVLKQKAGARWGIRSDECQFLEMALMRRVIETLKSNNTK